MIIDHESPEQAKSRIEKLRKEKEQMAKKKGKIGTRTIIFSL